MKRVYLILGIITFLCLDVKEVLGQYLIVEDEDNNITGCSASFEIVDELEVEMYASDVHLLNNLEGNTFRIQVVAIPMGIPIGISDEILSSGWVSSTEAQCAFLTHKSSINIPINFNDVPLESRTQGLNDLTVQLQIVEVEANESGDYKVYHSLSLLQQIFPSSCFEEEKTQVEDYFIEYDVCYEYNNEADLPTFEMITTPIQGGGKTGKMFSPKLSYEANLDSDKIMAKVFPNPVQDILTIELNTLDVDDRINVEIWDANGHLQQSSIQLMPIQTINTADLATGIYYVKFWNKSFNEVFRIIKI